MAVRRVGTPDERQSAVENAYEMFRAARRAAGNGRGRSPVVNSRCWPWRAR
jgi:hypothetical protein